MKASSVAAMQQALAQQSISFVMQGGGVRVNNVKVEAEQHVLKETDLIDGRLMLIAAGKKNKMLVRISS